MLPIPSAAARWSFLGCLCLALIAGLTASPSLATFAGAGLLGLAAVFVMTMPLGRQLRRQRLEFAWWLDHDSGAASGSAIPGAPFAIRCYLRQRSGIALEVKRLEPLSQGIELLDGPAALRIPAASKANFQIRALAPASGRVVLHGLAVTLRGPLGLFDTALYFPNPLSIKVLPRAAARTRRRPHLRRGGAAAPAGRTQVRHRGGGTELHELREFHPGDSFRSIAWKASARRGRLLVKEVEQEIQQTRWVLLDVSGTMRGGRLGERKLDHAIEAAATAAASALDAGDRVGLITFDSRVVHTVAPGEGKGHRLAIYDALLGATELIDADLTAIGDDALGYLVADYLRQQDGLEFAVNRTLDVPALVAHVRQYIDVGKIPKVISSGPSAAALRLFCQHRGIALPYRSVPLGAATGSGGAKAQALAEALRVAGGRTRIPASIVVLSDLDAMPQTQELIGTLKLLRAHHHSVSFAVPDARTYNTKGGDETMRLVHGRSEERRLREARDWILPTGAEMWRVRGDQAAGLAIR